MTIKATYGGITGGYVGGMVVDGGYVSGDYTGDSGYVDGYDGIDSGSLVDTSTGAKDPIMSSWLFVGGIMTVVMAASIFLGILLAKKRIKKGFDIYEI